MKYILWIFSSLMISSVSSAETSSVSADYLKYQSAVGMNEFLRKVSAEPLPASSTGCPAAGFKIEMGAEKENGGLVNAKKYVKTVGTLALTQSQTLKANNRCGTCRQTVHATPFVITQPAKVAYKQMCDGRPTVSFESDFQTDAEADNFTQDILNKKNQEGQRLYAGCPDPCAFTVYAGKRTLANGKTRSTMTVNCGQPRNTSILFAKYNFTYGTAVRWTCSK